MFSFLENITSYLNQSVYYYGWKKNDKWENIQHMFSNYNLISYKVFDYTKYPSWFNINIEAGHYAWKPTIIYNTYLEHTEDIIVWMDAGNLILDNLKELYDFLLKNGVYSGVSSDNIEKWTHPTTINYLKCSFIFIQIII